MIIGVKAKSFLLDIARGSTLGLGMIPGVSAGTMAVIAGFYDRLITGISELRRNFKKSFLSLLPLGIGAVVSAIIVMVLVHFGYSSAPVAISAAFAGIIIGSLPLLMSEIKNQKKSAKSASLIILGAIIAAGIGILSCLAKFYWNFDLGQAFIDGEWWVYLAVFAAGFIAATACIIPGISGAMILFTLGLYTPIINTYIGGNSMIHDHSRLLSGSFMTLSLVVGILLGFIFVSKAMKKLLSSHHDATFDAVIGFVLGSLVSLFLNQEMIIEAESGLKEWVYVSTPLWEWIVASLLLIAFAAIFFFVSRRSLKNDQNQNSEENTTSTTCD